METKPDFIPCPNPKCGKLILEERERIIKYLKIRWAGWEGDDYGKSRVTFRLPADWEQALRKE